MKKRILAFLLLFSAIFTMLPTEVFAYEEDGHSTSTQQETSVEPVTDEISEDALEVTSGTDSYEDSKDTQAEELSEVEEESGDLSADEVQNAAAEESASSGADTAVPEAETGSGTEEVLAEESEGYAVKEDSTESEAALQSAANSTTSYSLTLKYDDRYDLSDFTSADLSGYTIQSISTTEVTSYQVSSGKKTSSLDTDVVVASGSDKLIASGVGTATVTLYNTSDKSTVLLYVTVKPATLTVLYIAGQSNAEGATSGDLPENSILCEEGQVYSTYAPKSSAHAVSNTGISSFTGCTKSNAKSFVAGSLSGTTSLSGSELVYPLNALTEAGNGKTGIDSGLAYEWNYLTGDKVWVVNAAYSGSSITSWIPGETQYERALAVFKYAATTASAEISAGHYTRGNTLLFWMQGEEDSKNGMSSSGYISYFKKMKAGFDDSTLGIEYYGLITIRAHNGHPTTSEDLEMTGPRIAQYLMGNSTNSAFSNVYVVSNVNEQWVTNSGVKSYFKSVYGSKLTYPLRSTATISSIPTTVNEVHSSAHYSQVGHNENGLTAAKNMYSIVKGSGSSSISVKWYDSEGNALSSGSTVSLTVGNTYYYIPVVTPLSLSKNITISVSANNCTYNSSTGTLKVTGKGSGTITVKIGSSSYKLIVFSGNLATPTMSSVTGTSNGVSVSWASVSGAVKYRVFRKTGSGSWKKLTDTTSTSYTDTTAQAGTTYTYTIRCVDDDGNYASGYDTTGLTIKYASTPELTSVAGTSSGVVFKWSKATGAVKYRVFRKTSGGSWVKLADTTSTSYTDTTAKAGTTYVYTVRCISSAGKYTSGYKNSGLTIKYASTPKLSSVTGTSSGPMVTWAKATGAVKYRVFRKTSGGSWVKLTDTTSTSYTDTTAKAGTTYIYTVRCIDGNGNYASGYDTTGLTIKYASTPELTSVAGTNSGVVFKWSKATGAEKYRVFRKTSGGSWVMLADTTSTSYTDTTAKVGTNYVYTVRCISSAGKYTSGYKNSGLTIKYASTPKLSSVTNTSSGPKITWEKATGAVTYRVFRKTSGESWVKLTDTTSTSYTDTTAKAGTTYIYTVRCIDGNGNYASGYDTTGLTIRCV